jgi:predicted secreted hydrolase
VPFLILLLAAFRLALPGYHYEFPRDHFNHPEFQTEWWYYTGNVHDAAGHRYGFELVFFRHGEGRASGGGASAWRVDDLYVAHFAITDIDARRFRYVHRINRAGPGIAGVSGESGRIWNGNWQALWDTRSNAQTLSAMAEGMRVELRLTPQKPLVIHGEGGLSRTGAEPGQAAYYVSFPRLAVEGTLDGVRVSGIAWMDHEWFSALLDPAQQGWDWFSVQLANGAELMLFQLRRADGSTDAHSSGTYIPAAGKPVNLDRAAFRLQPLEFWTSPKTRAVYPINWRISLPSLHWELDCAAAVRDQELVFEDRSTPAYWEGAVTYAGAVSGVGYLEMTGYSSQARLGTLR